MRARVLVSAFTAALLACGTDDGSDGEGAGGGDPGGGQGAGNAGGPSTGGAGGTGLAQTCDDLGFCGQAEDPGCVACSVSEGSCVDELAACDRQCDLLRACYADCETEDNPCLVECEQMYPDEVDIVIALYSCILCVECPVSCNFDPSNCR